MHPGDPLNRDPWVTEEQLADYLQLRADAKAKGKQIASSTGVEMHVATGSVLGKRKTSALYGGTDRGLLSMVSSIGAEYLRSHAGIDDSGVDGALHSTLRWILDGGEINMDRVEKTHKALEYRMTQMSTADRYVGMMDIAAPKGQLFCEYNTKQNGEEIEEEQISFIERQQRRTFGRVARKVFEQFKLRMSAIWAVNGQIGLELKCLLRRCLRFR